MTLNPATFTGTIGVGGVQAAISALAEQGTVRVESKPEVAALNNQTAFVQVSEDQPFFSRTSTTTINAGGAPQAGAQPIVSTNYSESTVSFGNLLEITVQIADDLSTKLSLSPAMTELKGTVTSPDGQETAPITDTKRARTTVTLRNHETAVVGGFITETTAGDKRGVPGLSGVPLIGAAFGTSAKVRTRTELVFLVTVNVDEPGPLAPLDGDSPPRRGGRRPGRWRAHTGETSTMSKGSTGWGRRHDRRRKAPGFCGRPPGGSPGGMPGFSRRFGEAGRLVAGLSPKCRGTPAVQQDHRGPRAGGG